MFVSPDSEYADVKLIDFGLSQKFLPDQTDLTGTVGTDYSMAPELLTGEYNSKAHVWSLGVCVYDS